MRNKQLKMMGRRQECDVVGGGVKWRVELGRWGTEKEGALSKCRDHKRSFGVRRYAVKADDVWVHQVPA